MEEAEDKKEKVDLTEKLRTNPWILSTFVLGILAVVLLAGSMGNFSFTGNAISSEDAGSMVEDLIGATVNSVKEVSGLYEVSSVYQGQSSLFYVTKDGKYIGVMSSLEDVASESGAGTGETGGVSGEIDVDVDDDAVLGKADASVTMIEFSDYQCPFCRKFWAETYLQIKTKYIDTGKIKYVFRDFTPTLVNPTYHPSAVDAAMAAECAREKGGDNGYFKMHDKIFSEQQLLDSGDVKGAVTTTVSFTATDLKTWAKEIGYDIASCLDSEKFKSEVEKDLEDGQVAGVSGTPGFIIMKSDGTQKIPVYSGAQPFSVFEQIIEGQLSG